MIWMDFLVYHEEISSKEEDFVALNPKINEYYLRKWDTLIFLYYNIKT